MKIPFEKVYELMNNKEDMLCQAGYTLSQELELLSQEPQDIHLLPTINFFKCESYKRQLSGYLSEINLIRNLRVEMESTNARPTDLIELNYMDLSLIGFWETLIASRAYLVTEIDRIGEKHEVDFQKLNE